jgi:hypothetical protein
MKIYKNKILKRIRGKRRGWVFTPKDFIDIAPRNTIDQILFRLTKQGLIRKISRGVYDFPVIHQKLGLLNPSLDKLVKTVATQTNDIIQPSGASIVNQLGLDTQVPAKSVYLTSGLSKQKHIQNYTIRLKHSKIISQFGANPNLCRFILALQHLGKDHIDKKIINKCSRLLSNRDKKALMKAIPKLPHWMTSFIHQITRDQHGNVSQSQ